MPVAQVPPLIPVAVAQEALALAEAAVVVPVIVVLWVLVAVVSAFMDQGLAVPVAPTVQSLPLALAAAVVAAQMVETIA